MRGPMFVSRLFLIILAVVAASERCVAAPMTPQYFGETVFGPHNAMDPDDVATNVSLPISPHALCFGRTDDEILIGDYSYFRHFSRKRKVTGRLLGGSVVGTENGSWLDARLDKPQACVRIMTGNDMVVYFVEGRGALRYFTKDEVLTKYLGLYAFMDVAFYGTKLFMVEENHNKVWTCSLTLSNLPARCTEERLFASCGQEIRGIAVTRKGVFVVYYNTGNPRLCWFAMNGTKIASVDGKFVDVHASPSGLLYAASESEIYRVVAEYSQLKVERIVGDSQAVGPPCPDGENPVLCKTKRLFVVSDKEMYVSTKDLTVRSITLPPVNVNTTPVAQPLPVAFPDEDGILPKLIDLIKKAVDKALGTTGTVVDKDSMHVDEATWKTNVSVGVQQKDYDNVTTPKRLERVDYTEVIRLLNEYYDKTPSGVYVDNSILPYCNKTAMREIEQGLTAVVRDALQFPLIYVRTPEPTTAHGADNVTMLRILMPATFNNKTTRDALEAADLPSVLMNIVRSQYRPNNIASVSFPSPEYDFSRLSEEELNDVRWILRDTVEKRMKKCKQVVEGGSNVTGTGSNRSVGDIDLGDAGGDENGCRTVVLNRTVTQSTELPFGNQSTYELFVPNSYSFDVDLCLKGADWSDLGAYLSDASMRSIARSSQHVCNRGCIIGVAIASALVLAALIAAAVVLKSKRKRLAAVVAPARPAFRATLDDEKLEGVSGNPLTASAGGSR